MEDESRLSVLVVTDDPHLLEEAKFAFRDEVDVTFARDSRDAWKVIEERIPDVVVVDLQTGSAGGFNLITEMREQGRTAPSLLLLERPQDEWLGRQAGAHAIRVKPIDVADLVEETLALAGSQKTT